MYQVDGEDFIVSPRCFSSYHTGALKVLHSNAVLQTCTEIELGINTANNVSYSGTSL